MIEQSRLNELRRIYSGSNSEEYRTINQLVDEIDRLSEENTNLRRSAAGNRVEKPAKPVKRVLTETANKR